MGASKIARDITRAKRTQTLPEREAHLQSVLDTVPDAMIVIDSRHHAVIQRHGADLFGYQADEVVGKNVSMLMPEPV